MVNHRRTLVKECEQAAGDPQEVARVAYELYEQSGRQDGRDWEHWFAAERLVKTRRTATAA